ncbi:DUF3396 domain-containing protein [Orbus wheelerorum]|uniref:type VI immunity family protein n=1 Tax=Orbus wheelerorum TaxID=3074111 RepID=UPI00370D4FD3
MIDKLQQLLDEYRENETKFTYAHYLDPDNAFALKTGLVGCFYLNQAYHAEKRQAIAQVLALYDRYWGTKLHYGYFNGDPNKLYPYQDININEKVSIITSMMGNDLNFYWSNVDNLEFVPEYFISAYSRVEWHEELHRGLGYLQIYLPIRELESFGIDKLVEFISQISEILQPIHGFFGLGILHAHEYYDYQYLEYELAHQFLGLDISNIESDLRFRDGFKCINWLTVLSDELIRDKLGSLAELKQQNHDEAITFYPYTGGVVIRAGEVPQLGDVSHNPYPQHYVNVNALLKAARSPEIGSLGFGSINGEVRFNNRSSKEWQSRFDDVIATDIAIIDESADEGVGRQDDKTKAIRHSVNTGELCRHSGLYSATINGKLEYRELASGYIVAPFRDNETGNIYREVTWQLLRRDDGGEVFTK